MKKTILALAAIGGLAAFGTSPVAAKEYRYCLQQDGGAGPGGCFYDTYAQCRATAQGLIADCNINPRVAYREQGFDGGQGYGPRSKRYREYN